MRQLSFIPRPIRPRALRHARRHQLRESTVERRARGRHLLRYGMTIPPFAHHAVDGGNLSFNAAQTLLKLFDHVVGDLEFGSRVRAFAAGAQGFRLPGHAPTIRKCRNPCNTPGGIGIT